MPGTRNKLSSTVVLAANTPLTRGRNRGGAGSARNTEAQDTASRGSIRSIKPRNTSKT